ncbi:MAG: CotH kinase family protein [Ruminococcus sp.]|nr:CotH kinase family protein [Ruminococcus sp.]
MKKAISLIMVLCMIFTAIPFAVSAAEGTEELIPNPEAYPSFELANWEALYAHGTLGGDSKEAWQKWMKDYSGIHAEEGVRYFFLPASADDSRVEIYNGYNEDAVIDDVTIPTKTSAFIDYTEGEAISVQVGETRSYTFKVYKSDAEASLYINDITNSYVDYEGNVQETDLWSFLIQSKENYVNGAGYSIVSEDGVQDGTLKKIKGRGNTNWKETDKKPFNINFSDMTTIGSTTSKKFSLVANAKDPTLLRNTIMYDLAHDVGNPYSSDQSVIDFYVNGVYRGSYIACQKVDLGKNASVSLKDESEDLETGFNFLVEVDVWNYKLDTYFVSEKGYPVVLKTPDLEDFEAESPEWQVRYDYIKDTYQKLEDALYGGTLADIEAICDIESLATQYLLQDFGKNCDGGYTSTFFTYNAEEGKFYAAPIWDCDSHLGAVDVWRDGCSTSTSDHKGWTTRDAIWERTVNPLGQPFRVKGTTADGKTYLDICKEIWKDKFLPKIDVLLGKAEPAEGDKLKSIDTLAASIEKSTYINYIMWDFMWLCQDKNSSIKKEYTEDVAGELQYMKDWVQMRAEWITNEYENGNANPPAPTDEREVYFTTELDWTDVHYYVWGTGYIGMRWPGEKAEAVGVTKDGNTIYKAVVSESKAQKIIFNDGIDGAQTVNIDIPTEKCLFYTTDESGRINEAGEPFYNVDVCDYPEEATEPSEPSEPSEPTIPTEPSEPTVPTEPEKPTLPKNTITAFVFDSTDKVAGEKLEEYGTKEGYNATFGEGKLVASVNSDGYRALEWSEAEYGESELEKIPIMPAGSKNPWGENPYVEITLSTKGYEDIAISLTSAGSKKCPATWQLAYTLDGETFTDIEGARFTIPQSGRKLLVNYLDNQALPAEVADAESVTLRLYAVSADTISGGTTADDPTGGELALNNIIITGNAIGGEEGILGDADENGIVNIKDATLIQKHVAGLVTLQGEALNLSDCDKDTKVTVKDATAIQKLVAGLIEEF